MEVESTWFVDIVVVVVVILIFLWWLGVSHVCRVHASLAIRRCWQRKSCAIFRRHGFSTRRRRPGGRLKVRALVSTLRASSRHGPGTFVQRHVCRCLGTRGTLYQEHGEYAQTIISKRKLTRVFVVLDNYWNSLMCMSNQIHISLNALMLIRPFL